MKRYRSFLKEIVNPILKSIKLEKGNFIKTIDAFNPNPRRGETQYELVIDTESPAPTSLKGVKSSLVRKKFDSEESIIDAFEKSVKMANQKGWKIWKFGR